MIQYIDHSSTLKACAGLNGMKLGGCILTVVQALPDAPEEVLPHTQLYIFITLCVFLFFWLITNLVLHV